MSLIFMGLLFKFGMFYISWLGEKDNWIEKGVILKEF